MGQVSACLRSAAGGFSFWCPGCDEVHSIRTKPPGPGAWTFNGNLERPTFQPSILVTGVQTVKDDHGEWTGEWVLDDNGKPKPMRCHTFITDGRIQFLGDCTHALAGQTVAIPALPDFLKD